MNDNPNQLTEFVLRRLSESFRVGGHEVNPYLWLAVLIPVLAAGLGYVVWMYRRDCRSIRWPWAICRSSATVRAIRCCRSMSMVRPVPPDGSPS